MNIGVTDVDLVKKNSNDFSFSKEVLNEVVNEDFMQGAKDFYSTLTSDSDTTAKSYIWQALSAVTDDVGETLYQNVLNYVDNVSDIDTCSIKALQSMVQLLGTRYNVLDGIVELPLELANLIDVFSMRRECLVNSQYVCQQMVEKMKSVSALSAVDISENDLISSTNKYRSESKLSNDQRLSAQISASPAIDISQLDKMMYDTISATIMNFLDLSYGKMTDDKPIRTILSNSILCSGFDIPNKSQSKIDEYKTRWHIPPEFNPEDAVEDIEAGLSTIDDYQEKYKGLIEIEYDRENAALNKLEPMTRYAYFKEKKVKEYYKFVQDQYLQIADRYNNATKYDVDNTYLLLDSSKNGKSALVVDPLMQEDGGIKGYMVNAVVNNLLDVIHKVQNLREYLKSHAQRAFMKGTFLLISYAVNEYLKQNIYPTVQKFHTGGEFLSATSFDDDGRPIEYEKISVDNDLEYSSDENVLELIEYVDQTQYFNIRTDVDNLSTKGFSTLNGKYWNAENTTNGAATFVDSTNVLNSADKSQIIIGKQMQLNAIADFYDNILSKPENKLSSGNTYINNFLTSVFASGADDSWWHDAHKKVMATLSDQTKTIDIDNYVDAVSAARTADITERILSAFESPDGQTVKFQLDLAKQQYIDSLSSECDNIIDNLRDWLDNALVNIDDLLATLESYHSQFVNLESRCDVLYNAYGSQTTGFIANEDYLKKNLDNYIYRARFNLDNIQEFTRNNIIVQGDILASTHAKILNSLHAFCKSTKYLSHISINSAFDIASIMRLSINDFIYLTYSQLSATKETVQSQYYEVSYNAAVETLENAKTKLAFEIEEIIADLLALFKSRLDKISLGEFDDLSILLSSYDFYNATFSIVDSINSVSAALDYSDDAWYKYKCKLFMKYTGQDVGDTPHYYLENKVHPSYQIHPCLSNFVQKVDFSYPIMNLGGMADDILQQYESSLVCSIITSNGYLKEMWKNPMNSNTDYVVRYEQENHIDSNLSANQYFGWDGLIHPDILANHMIQSTLKTADLETILSGQNLLSDEYKNYNNIIDKYKTIYKQLTACDIKQYGLDWYGNSYILLSGNNNNTFNNTLWFRPKNIPIPFPAFAYTDSNMEESSMSCCAFSHISTSNTYFKNIVPKNIIDQIYVPEIIDFNFTQDNTVLMFRCKNATTSLDELVFGKVIQDKDNVTPIRWHFLQDTFSRIEHLTLPTDASWEFACWYTERTQFGVVYVNDYAEYAREKCNIYVSKFDRQTTHENVATSVDISTPYRNSNVFADCDVNGKIALAYSLSGDRYSGKLDTLKEDSMQYTGKQLATNDLLSTYGDTTLYSIAAQEIFVAGNSIFVQKLKVYKPMQEAGFILATTNTDISGTGLMDELSANGVLKFKLAVPSASISAGIDFRHVCPIRQIEGYRSDLTEETTAYHYNTSEVAMSGVISGHSNVHFFESVYNQYLATMNDEQFYELAEAERIGRKNPDKVAIQANFDYQQLAHYDVAKYLSAMRSEESISKHSDDITDVLKHRGFVQPYMMAEGSIPQTYQYGAYIVENSNGKQNAFKADRSAKILDNIKTNTAVIKLDQNEELSVRWIKRTNGEIKLDFNSLLYIDNDDAYGNLPEWQNNFNSILSGRNDTNKKDVNERNKLNLFLNLDYAGEAGIINTWSQWRSYLIYKNTWMVKNISDSEPKFILAKLDRTKLDKPDGTNIAQQVAGIEYNDFLLASSRSQQTQIQPETYLVVAEGPILRYISFE